MKKSTKNTLTLIAGILLAIAVVCSNIWGYKTEQAAKQKHKTEQSGSKEKKEVAFSAQTSTIPSVFNIQLNLDTHCLFTLTDSEEVEESEPVSILEPQKLLLTLFTVIISPNAP